LAGDRLLGPTRRISQGWPATKLIPGRRTGVLDRGWPARARDPGNIGSARVQECGISSVAARHYKRFDLIGSSECVPRPRYAAAEESRSIRALASRLKAGVSGRRALKRARALPTASVISEMLVQICIHPAICRKATLESNFSSSLTACPFLSVPLSARSSLAA